MNLIYSKAIEASWNKRVVPIISGINVTVVLYPILSMSGIGSDYVFWNVSSNSSYKGMFSNSLQLTRTSEIPCSRERFFPQVDVFHFCYHSMSTTRCCANELKREDCFLKRASKGLPCEPEISLQDVESKTQRKQGLKYMCSSLSLNIIQKT